MQAKEDIAHFDLPDGLQSSCAILQLLLFLAVPSPSDFQGLRLRTIAIHIVRGVVQALNG